MARNYSNLSPYDFECLIRDLIQKELGERLETFPPGRDGGVDIRLFKDEEERVVVQCKHSPGKTYEQIKSSLKKEAEKANSFPGKRYILATSASLTRANKQEISILFSGAGLSQRDIWAVDDIDNLINKYPMVEQGNFKLWITSTPVMQRVLHGELYERSLGLVDRVRHKARIYVHSEAYSEALKILDDHGTCLISGEPGIGKTTLAEILTLKFLDNDWYVYQISEDVSEIEKIWNQNERQLFIYDDFLGQNSLLEKMNKNEDSRLAQIVSRIEAIRNKRLILTTREYILQQANQVYEPLHRSPQISRAKYTLDLKKYTLHQKAQILYNHLHFSSLPREAIDSVIKNRAYQTLTSHPNYNPRLIELATTTFHGDQSGQSFIDYFENALDNPTRLWEAIFENQLSDTERHILVSMALIPGYTSLQDLKDSVHAYEEFGSGHKSSRRDFHNSLRRLQGTFLSISEHPTASSGSTQRERATLVRLANPSFSDYVRNYLTRRLDEIGDVIGSSIFFDQLLTLWRWHVGGFQNRPIPSSMIMRQPKVPQLEASHFLNGLERTFIEALIHATERPSCRWTVGRGAKGIARRVAIDQDRRDVEILRVNQKINALSSNELSILYKRSEARVADSTQPLSVKTEAYVIDLLRGAPNLRHDIEDLHARALSRSMDSLEYLEDFEDALHLARDSDSQAATEKIALLSDKFLGFSERWDEHIAETAVSLSECEEQLAALTDVALDFGVESYLRTPNLERAIDNWAEREAHRYDMDREFFHDSFQAKPANIPIASSSPQNDIDELFDSL